MDACREVHSSDILKAHTNNVNTDESDLSKIHWAKWNLIGKFIHELVQLQAKSRAAAAREALVTDEEPSDAAGRRNHAALARIQRVAVANLWRDSAIMSPEVSFFF
jgi:hypothetical protein